MSGTATDRAGRDRDADRERLAGRERDADRERLVESASASPAAGRLTSLDVFRGITVAGMILANNMGRPSYSPFRHADWDGWTPTDLIFPSFLFIVGVSITFALTKRREAHADLGLAVGKAAGWAAIIFVLGLLVAAIPNPSEAGTGATIRPPGVLLRIGSCYLIAALIFPQVALGPVVGKVVRRAAIIFALGLLLAAFPKYLDGSTWAKIRIPGVLQRIALCYVAAALIFLGTRVRGQVVATVALLMGYFALMRYAPAPHFAAGDWAKGHDLGSYLDRLLLPGHIYRPEYDPEGLLSTLPAVATTLLGVLAGHWLRSGRERPAICSGLFVAGTLGVILGASWDAWFPVNKALWTSSFVLLAGGWSSIGLATCYWLIDVQGHRLWSVPFRVLGTNPIVAYCLASIGARVLNMPLLRGDEDKWMSVHTLYSNDYLKPYLWPEVATLAYAATLLLACILVAWVMDLLHLHVRA